VTRDKATPRQGSSPLWKSSEIIAPTGLHNWEWRRMRSTAIYRRAPVPRWWSCCPGRLVPRYEGVFREIVQSFLFPFLLFLLSSVLVTREPCSISKKQITRSGRSPQPVRYFHRLVATDVRWDLSPVCHVLQFARCWRDAEIVRATTVDFQVTVALA
jgi:hypothetical protein